MTQFVSELPPSLFGVGGDEALSFDGLSNMIATQQHGPSETMALAEAAQMEPMYKTLHERRQAVQALTSGSQEPWNNDNVAYAHWRFETAYNNTPPNQPEEQVTTAIVAVDTLLRRAISLESFEKDVDVAIDDIRLHAAIGHAVLGELGEHHPSRHHDAAALLGRHAAAEALLTGGDTETAKQLAVQSMQQAKQAKRLEKYQPKIEQRFAASILIEDAKQAAMLAQTAGPVANRVPGSKKAREQAREQIVTYRRFRERDLAPRATYK